MKLRQRPGSASRGERRDGGRVMLMYLRDKEGGSEREFGVML